MKMSTATSKLILSGINSGVMTREIFNIKAYYEHLQRTCGQDFNFFISCSEEDKIRELRTLSSKRFLEEQPAYWGIIPHIFRPDCVPMNTKVNVLSQNDTSKFNVNIPIDTFSTFMGMQYLQIDFAPPELADTDANTPYLETAKFSYTAKPGIRALKTLNFMSNDNFIQTYDYLDVLRIDKEYVLPSYHKQWNRHICHDVYETANVFNPAVEIDYGVKTKNGFQTPKHTQDGLSLLVPLFFDHNQCFDERFNLNSFLKGTLNISGELEASKHLVKAEHYPTDLTEPIVRLECKPLRVSNFNLISEKFFVDNAYHALMSGKQISKFVRYFGNKTGTIKNDDPEQKIPVVGKGYVESFTFCIRPLSYENDFDKWHELSEITQKCSPTVIVVADDDGLLKKLAIKPASIKKAIVSLEKIGLITNDDYSKPLFDPRYYADMESYRNARSNRDYHPRDNMMYKFHFNHHLRKRMLSGMYVQTKFDETLIDYVFKPEYINPVTGRLKTKWQYIIYRDLCNQQFGVGSSLSTLYLL